MLLLNPGPVSLTERVRRSLLQPDLCHREPEFFDLQDEARRRLLGVYGLNPAEWTAVLLTGSGTAAVESMLAALVPEDGKVLIVENGVYGERMSEMASRFGIGYAVARHGWTSAVDIASLRARLDKEPGVTHLAVVHHETTTGRLNDLAALEHLCRERGIRLLVDAVSSFGAEPIHFHHGSITAVAATANKCLHGIPGVAFVVVRRDALAHIACRSYYLDLSRLALLQDRRDTPFTPSVHAYYALVEALTELEDDGGWVQRHARYHRHALRLMNALSSLGIHALIPEQESSVVLRAYRLPPGTSYTELHDRLKADGFVIYAGQGALSPDIFRISVMGDLHESDMDRLILAFEHALQSNDSARRYNQGTAVLGTPERDDYDSERNGRAVDRARIMRSAVVLAAGGGTRIASETSDPKSLLEVCGKSLIRQHLEHLAALGFEDVVVVVGYQKELLRSHLAGHSWGLRVRTVENEDYKRLGNGVSLCLGLEHVTGPCIVIDGDLVYEREVMGRFVTGEPEDSILVGPGKMTDIESTKTITDGTGQVTSLADKRALLPHEEERFLGEAMGVLMFTEERRYALLRAAERFFEDQGNLLKNWEHLINYCLPDQPLIARFVDAGRWIEIDTPGDYAEARRLFERDAR